MASNTVSITLTVDEASALKAWTSQQAAVEKLKNKLKDLELKKNPLAPLQAGAVESLKFLRDAMAAITGIGGAISGVVMLANQLKSEYQNLKSRQASAAGTNVDYGAEITKAIASTRAYITAAEMENLTKKGSMDTGASPAVVAQNYNAAFTTVGPRTKAEALDAMGVANATLIQYPGEAPDTIADVTQVAAQNKREFGLTTQEALGYQQQAQNVSPVKNLANFANNVAGKLSALAKAGDMSAAESAAFSGTLAQAGGDREGATSMMAAFTMVSEMKERLPNLKTNQERLDYFRNNPEASKAYFEGGVINGKKFSPAETGRSVYRPHVQQLFDPQSQISQEYQANLQSFGGKKEWAADIERVRAEIGRSQSVQIAKAQRQGEATVQQLQIEDTSGAMTAVARKIVQDVSKTVGDSDLTQKLNAIDFEVNAGMSEEQPLQLAAQRIREKSKKLKQVGELVDDGFGNEYVRENRTKDQIEQDLKKAESLDAAEQRLVQIDRDFQKARFIKKAEPQINSLRESRDMLKEGKEPRNLQEILVTSDKEIRRIASESSEYTPDAGKELINTQAELVNEIMGLQKNVRAKVAPVPGNPDRVKRSIQEADQSITAAEQDGKITPEEMAGIRDNFTAAEKENKSAQSNPSALKDAPALAKEMAALSAKFDKLVMALEKNTTVTSQNSAANAGKPQSTPSPPVARTVPVTSLQSKG